MEAICGPAIPLLLPVFDLDGAMADPALRAELLFWFGAALMLGPVRVAEAGRQLQSLAARFDSPLEQAWLDLPLGMLDAYEAWFDDARARFRRARAAMQEAGAGIYYASNGMFVAWMELTAGRPAVAEAIAREGWDMLGAAGEQGLRSSVGLHLAQALIGLGRDEEAESTAHEAVALTSGHDRSAQFHHRGLLALVRARAGRTAEAVELARESVAIAHATDSAWHRAEAQVFLAEVAAGDERRAALAELLRLIDEHGFTVYRRHAERLGSHAAERVVPHDVALGEGLAG
jgi:hypothetical protein